MCCCIINKDNVYATHNLLLSGVKTSKVCMLLALFKGGDGSLNDQRWVVTNNINTVPSMAQNTHHTEPYAPVPICLSRVYFSGTSHTVLLISSREKCACASMTRGEDGKLLPARLPLARQRKQNSATSEASFSTEYFR